MRGEIEQLGLAIAEQGELSFADFELEPFEVRCDRCAKPMHVTMLGPDHLCDECASRCRAYCKSTALVLA